MNDLAQHWPEIVLFALIAATASMLFLRRRKADAQLDEADTKSLPNARLTLATRLRHAGFDPSRSAWFFKVIQIFGAAIAMLFSMSWIEDLPINIAIGIFAYILPDLWLRKRVKRRQNRIRAGLSLFVDLITSLARSGMTLEKTFTLAAREGFPSNHPLAIEVKLLGRELSLGRERDSAFRLLAERTGVVQLKALASAIRMGLRSGAPVETALESQAEFLRFQQQEDATKKLTKAAASTMIPVFLSGIPLWAVVVYFPLVLEILETVKTLKPF